jgi:hypothetical protein
VQAYSESLPDSHQIFGLPPDWRPAAVWSPPNRAAQFVMRRYHVPPHTAEVIAALAGLGSEVAS